ncbi:thiamine pyrophosphate-dependent enzyme [Alistipes indistinctus]|jgi:thiamine pyrophosphate-dependent acetolactate synthase large subunit-like protein|uniref:thiamine pyrophosphate-dependent enzyme n=1 Tax=Alistipes indistinctus TaxID=626932 RepID=UPI0026DCDDE3|nr:thiamine pyrophosphate-dependent enzyme [Alistipes indistinctus]
MKRTDTDKGNPHAISSNYIARWVDRNVEQSSVIMVDRKIVTDCKIQSSGKNDRRDIIVSEGNTLAQAVDSALAWPERSIVVLCSRADTSSFGRYFSIIVRHRLPIKIVVLNSLSGGLWRLLAEMAGREKWEADLYDTDFGAFAQVMGMEGFSLSDPAKADEMLRRMFEMEGPALLDVKTVSAGSGARTDRKEANVSRFTPVALPARKVWRNRHFDGKRIGR